MAQKILNNGMTGAAFRGALNDNFTELYSSRVPINHAVSATTYGVGTTSNYGHVKVTAQNGLSITSGTIAMAAASTSQIGAVQLVDDALTNDSTKAATAAALKGVKDSAILTYSGTSDPSSSLGKNGDIYIKLSS